MKWSLSQYRNFSLFRNKETGKRAIIPILSEPIENLLVRRLDVDRDIARLLGKSTSALVYSFIAVSACGTLGIDTKPFIAGLGVTGFTIGFALKDIATNFLSGIMLMAQKPFRAGDTISVAGFEGTVVTIDTRYLVLRNSKGGIVMIPSTIVYSNAVTVISKAPPSF